MLRSTTPPRRLLLVALLVAPLLSGCAFLGALLGGTLKKPTLAFRAVTVEVIDFDGATLAFDYRLTNPNGFGLTLTRVEYWLGLDGHEAVRGQVEGGLTIPASGEAPVRFTARLPFAEVPRLLELLQRGGSVAYTLGGRVGLSTPLGAIELPVEHAGRVDLPGLPHFRLAGVGVRLSSLADLELDVRLAVHNPNPFPLPATSLRYTLTVGGEVVVSGATAAVHPVAARADGELVIPVKVSLLGVGHAAAAVRGGGAEVKLSGEVKLGPVRLPLELGGRLGER
jgi:LEA14-like dessication related protein